MEEVKKNKTIPTELLNPGWYIGLYAGNDSCISVKYWDGDRWNNTQNPASQCDVYFEPKAEMRALVNTEDLKSALKQACEDLNTVHTEWMEDKGVSDGRNYDYPSWTSPANTLRWAEKLLGIRLTKDQLMSRFPKNKLYE